MNRFVLRQERFGGLLFDRRSHVISAVGAEEYARLGDMPGFDVVPCDNWLVGCETLSAPTKIFFVLTKKCNLFCLHCLNDSGPRQEETIHLPLVGRLLAECRAMGVFEIGLCGGEPLLHPDFFAIVESVKQQGFPLYLNTNGVCNLKTLERLCAARIDSIKISLDGLRENNDRIRGKGSFDKALRTARRLREADCHVRLNYTLMAETQADCFAMARLADELGCDLKIAPLIPVGRAKSLLPSPPVTDSGLQGELDRLRQENQIKIGIELMEEMEAGNCALVEKGKPYHHTTCGIRQVHLGIDSDGLAYATGRQTDFGPELRVGNVHAQSLAQVWHEAALKNREVVARCAFCGKADVRGKLASCFSSTIPLGL